MRNRRLLLLAAAVIATAAVSDVEGAAEPPANVPLTVVVKDKKGAAVPDLKPDEIELLENGTKRPVDAVRFVSTCRRRGRAERGQLVSLVFAGMDVDQQRLAKKAVEDLLAHDLGPNTLDRGVSDRPAAVDGAAVHA